MTKGETTINTIKNTLPFRTWQDPEDGLWWIEIKDTGSTGGFDFEYQAVNHYPTLLAELEDLSRRRAAFAAAADAAEWRTL
jgi:hypothetical protein